MSRTSYKQKIPKTLSYPVGAEILSETLGDVPQASELHISFRLFRPLCSKSGHKEPYPVLQVEHSGTAMPSHLRWGLRVWSVSCDASHDVKDLLAAEGLIRVKRWLQTKAWLKQTNQAEIDREV